MKAIELLEKYPLSTEIVRTWFIEKMIESIKGADEVPEACAGGLQERRLV